ncbi:dynein axonemal heavy chain 2-like [Babylonia areolata]|uniref:dynein axonemal heavy chain 2-like n=1 Tax=Babylonia areolata TaxID=304850 RepID=UPI003FD2D455
MSTEAFVLKLLCHPSKLDRLLLNTPYLGPALRNDFSEKLHRFMSGLTDARWKLDGKTVLYIPHEGVDVPIEVAADSKEYVQRMEVCVIHWSRQIKQVLNIQSGESESENASPLAEVEHWKNRCTDLSGITSQLDQHEVVRIIKILTTAKSHYIAPFLKLAGEIQEGSRQAESNVKFLATLKEPCHQLGEATPAEIPALLPRILNLIRIIWVNSEFYRSREQLTGLLRKVSNQVIARCRAYISLDKLFDGYIISSRKHLQQCIECSQSWQNIYRKTAAVHQKFSPHEWKLDENNFFSQMEAFVQRCKDLLEVCDAQQHFARFVEGNQIPLPQFWGHKGLQIACQLKNIEDQYFRNLRILRQSKNSILDVKSTTWHADYTKFCSGIKDVEVMTQNVLNNAFKTVLAVNRGIEILDVFMHLQSRELLRRCLEKKTVDVYALFVGEMNAVKAVIAQKAKPLTFAYPKYAGSGHWARFLRKRLEKQMMDLDKAFFLPTVPNIDDIRHEFSQIMVALEDYIRKGNYDWTVTVDKDTHKLLECPIMAISKVNPHMIDVNLKGPILKLFQEVQYWKRLSFECPHFVASVYRSFDKLRRLREMVLLIVRDHNRIIAVLSPEEQALFHDRIVFVEKKLKPGLFKFQWVSTVSDMFITECRITASKVQRMVDEYKDANSHIMEQCVRLSEMLLISIPDGKLFEDLSFAVEQKRHRANTQNHMKNIYTDIVQCMRKTYSVFSRDSSEVQAHWYQYTEKTNAILQEAFRLNIKRSLMAMSKAINGDAKSGPYPLFNIKVVLEKNKIEFSPHLNHLAIIIANLWTECVETLTYFASLPTALGISAIATTFFFKEVAKDEEAKKWHNMIMSGVQANAQNLQNYLSTWDNFKDIWEINKDAFIRRYQKMKPTVASFESDIARYTEVSNNVQTQETVLNIQFVLLDCSPLKAAICGHCQDWQNKFTSLLVEMATTELHSLNDFMVTNGNKIITPPQNLEEYAASIKLQEYLNTEKPNIQARFEPLAEQFHIIGKYEVPVSQDDVMLHADLGNVWYRFQEQLIASEDLLNHSREYFKTALMGQSNDVKNEAQKAIEEFAEKGPFTSDKSPDDALAYVAEMRKLLNSLKEQDATIRKGLGMFKIDHPVPKELLQMEKELDTIEAVWNVAKDWETMYNGWKVTTFKDIKTLDMEYESQNIFKKVVKFSKELKDRNWEIVETTKHRIDQFRRTMPLVSDLKNKAFRPRHWEQIQTMMDRTFDHESSDFTLEVIINFGFDTFANQINEISVAATKELAIEKGLNHIKEFWTGCEYDIIPYKDKGIYKFRGTDDIFSALEENQVSLTTMKVSHFVKPFAETVDKWERLLSNILEVTEMLLVVQRLWMYMENIFLGEDIRKQLPQESAQFETINLKWKEITRRMYNTKKVIQCAAPAGQLEQLNQMNKQLEDIQKSLDVYLETKRQIFPRFYFISNDDLLEILGQSKNPEAIQPHLKKCFDNIKSLKLSTNGKKWEAAGMSSVEGEYVEFASPMTIEGPVESWLCEVEKTMRWTLKEVLKNTRTALKKQLNKRDRWIKDWPGQMCITASQIQWTADVTRALNQVKERGEKRPLKHKKKKQVHMLDKFSDAIRGNLTKNQRSKIVALVTIEVHARDIIDKLYKTGCNDTNAFDWLSQLRLYWEKEYDDCIVRQTNTQFQYGYEYLGNSGRLVITPLTDRCYMTLTTALNLHRGGSPKGPAGTGKTETTKDLGKALGMYVIVVNCSDGLDYKSMGRMFSGLSQTGAWGCFDEFNRINIEVLSVVAQQILSILSALAANQERFVFEGREINLVWSCGMFITMNPGYAGRTELPDNLKSMFRPIAMVVPDCNLICEILLFAEGFGNTKVLAKKVFTLYSLAVQQLSKQDHYDFALRAIVSVLRYSGKKKRANPTMSDEEVILLSMKDMNVPKLTSADLPLFNGIMSDLFPGIETSTVDYSKLENALKEDLKALKLQVTKITLTKIIQLYETKLSRHSVMTVGCTQSGKTVAWRVLQAAMGRLHDAGDPDFQIVKDFPLNPKAVSLAELYGEFDLGSGEWADGVLSSVMRNTCADERPDEKWIVFDGPVDTLWIESMNSVMDDNKILTLINGERINMPEQVSLLFEVEDLAVASPATVSRCGMVFNDYQDIGWEPYVHSWLDSLGNPEIVALLKNLFSKWLTKMLKFRNENCKELVPIAELNGVASLCKLFTCLGTLENGIDPADPDSLERIVELWFMFCMIWSICCSVNEEGRKRIDNVIRENDGTIPTRDSVYEYYVDPKNKSWVHWDEKLKGGWRYNPEVPFFQQFVPTVDTVRYRFLISSLITCRNPVMLVGPVGTGKTSVAEACVGQLDQKEYNVLTVNMSARTSSNNVQDIIESRVEKRTKGVYVPVGGKKLITVMDDFNMPAKDTFGSQPPLELIKLWIDYGFWYNRKTQATQKIMDMLLVAAMGPPGGGRMVISRRLQSRFNLINMTFPQESQIKRIYGSMISQKLVEFDEEVKTIADTLTQATIEMYEVVVSKFLPTPAKIHYLFNLRDISRVFQGLLRADKNHHDTTDALTKLWTHECFRVFSDRLVSQKDMDLFLVVLGEKLGSLFNQTLSSMCQNKQPPLFGDYMSTEQFYEEITDGAALKKCMSNYLNDYNNSPGVVFMDLVLFRDAMEHVSKIVRVIRQPRGNMLLVGIGGSGRQSLSRLASFICEYKTFQIEVTKHYGRPEFRDDLKKLYFQCGVENRPTVFLFNDTQVVEEVFLEDINNILSSGEVPNLYKPDEFEDIKNTLEDICRKEGVEDNTQAVFAFLINRVRANLHIVLCMSPVGEAFRNRIRMYPAFVNCTTIDWFHEWPLDALLEVADRYLADMDLGGEENEQHKPNLAHIFSIMQKSVSDYSKRMLLELKRTNYVTPTNYLELVSGYKTLYYEKRNELNREATKLGNGLSKIDDTRDKVEKMSVELEDAKKQVVEFQKQCDEYLKVLVQQKQEADEQQKAVTVTSARIREEGKKCQEMADAAQADLDQAMPALNAAVEALESLNKKDMTEIKSYGRPPPLVEKVMNAVMILRQSEPSWAESKKQLGDPNFLNQLMNFDKDNISDKILKRIGKFCDEAEFVPEVIGRVSTAAKSLCMWVRAMESYGRIYRIVEPKRQRLNKAMAALKEKQDMLAEAQARLAELEKRMEELKKSYEEKLAQKEELKKKAAHMELMMDRARRLVEGLSGERIRWKQTVEDLVKRIGYLPGDCLIAAAFMSYMGPFLSEYRDEITKKVWMAQIKECHLPHTPGLRFTDFMAKPTVVRDWNIQGLPNDSFSTENGVIVTRGSRWPLMVDPQSQAIKWIKNMEGEKGLKVIDFQQPDYMRTLETAIHMGLPVILQNVQEHLDPSLDPVLTKSLVKAGGVEIMKLGDREIEYNHDFRFYITTRLSNPHYPPEISTKTLIVNFAVKLQGLESQLLAIVVRKEKPELEDTKDNLVRGIAAGKKKLLDLENEILRLLNETKGSLLEDETLLLTLETSKATSQEVAEQLATSETTEVKIDAAREGYRPCALRASILFFVLNDMGRIDPMYQFSLDAYIELFIMSIEKSQRTNKLEERIVNLNDYHTYAVYRYTCRALFEKHKLLFSFQMCAKILEYAGKLNKDEYNFLIRGGVVMDRGTQMDNPCIGWLSDISWDNITELDKLTNFHDIVTSFEQYPRDWQQWYISANPETSILPDVWENSCNELQRMLLVRSLRPDRVSFCVTSFITNNLGSTFVEPPVLNMDQVVEDSTCRTPLIFVLSPGVDPTGSLLQLAESRGYGHRFRALSLGQGQAPIATRYLLEGSKEGSWVFLANCHLSLSWMPQLDKLVEHLQTSDTHPEFRLWLSSSPHPEFPISILQQGIKITTEPPKGLKANLTRLYSKITDAQFDHCKAHDKYRRLLFCLCFFHSVLLERRKFLMLGWNIAYEFNDSDFEVSENLLSIYLDIYEDTPWDALKYLIANINYGGHVTDDWDRRLLMTYMNDFYAEKVLTEPLFKLSSLPTYFVPRDNAKHGYVEYVSMLPSIDHPEAFGQHPNADIASQIQETRLLFDTLISLAPQVTTSGGESSEDKVLDLSASIYKQIPENIDYNTTAQVLSVDPCPLNVVLLQEIQRYNVLLDEIRVSLKDLEKGIQGLVVMTLELEIVFKSLFEGHVPPTWQKAYNSMKPLGSWTRDLVQRMDQLSKWAETSHPPTIFWMSGFTFPTGFLTAVLQTYARSRKVSVDVLQWEFFVLTISDANVTGAPKDGVYIKGLYLQGAGWDKKNSALVEAEPMELVCPMPSIHFKPTESRKKGTKGMYSSPCYYYPNRAGGGGRPSFVVAVDLKSGEKTPEHWIKRGTALLMSLDN